MNTIVSPTAKRAIDLAYKEHWRFRVVGQGEIPNEPKYVDQWWLRPVSKVPQQAQERVALIQRAGIGIRGVVVAHEAPRQLSAPKAENKPHPKYAESILPVLGVAAGVLGQIAILMGYVLFAAILDPAVIVILDDDAGTWLEVIRWYE